ncbi:hypothetical protein LSCM1_02327 [Leishmania martiniquensis]|uniref:non-specific serine/threonine protein kinase n=1 Tax=Leishmania martiniquensis TaxID=1580590 RepID=A0A836GIJ9_9TRYP|nr:hypothetical protein LSCM1_02327 [Leishmania martiniquensis]
MQVDIGNNTVRQNFSSIILSEEIRQLNDRLQEEYAGAALAPATTASHQGGGGVVGSVLPQRRGHPGAEGTAGAPSWHESAAHLHRRPSLNLSRPSAESRYSHHYREASQYASVPHSRSAHSQSPEESTLRALPALVGGSHIAPAPWIAFPANSTTTINHTQASNRATVSVRTRGLSNYATPPYHARQLPLQQQPTANGFGGAEPPLGPMATVTSTQHRQQGWADALHHNGGAASAVAVVNDAPSRFGDNAVNGLANKEIDAKHRANEGSGNLDDKPAAAPIPKLAQTKIQIGMRLRRWLIIGRIGAGSFGETFTAMEVNSPTEEDDSLTVASENLRLIENLPPPEERNEVCIKVEQENKNVLRLEALALKKVQPCSQVVRYIGSGCTNGMNYVVMQKLGSNLAELRRRSQHGTFNIYTTLKTGISCLTAIRGVHDLGLVHRDIKPSNFVTGLPGTPEHITCYLIDFGLARRFRRSNGEIRPPRDNAGFRGTSRYASVASHHHQELGRVDDLWSLLFMLVEFATGTLPWRKYKEKDDIGRCKEESISPHLVRNLPREFQPFLAHLQTLRYEDEPDYDLLLTLMHRALERRGYPPNKPVEWEIDASVADSGIDAEGVPMLYADTGAPRSTVAQPQNIGPAPDALANGHAIPATTSSKLLQAPPRRTAPQPDAVETGSGELQRTHLPSGAVTAVHVAVPAVSGSNGLRNGVVEYGHPADTLRPHNSGTVRVSEVDVGGFGAGQDTPLGVDVVMQHPAQCLQAESADVPGATVEVGLGDAETNRASTSSEERGVNDYSPREIDEGRSRASTPVYRFNIAGPPDANCRGITPAELLASTAREPNSGSRMREGSSNRSVLPHRGSQPRRGTKSVEVKYSKKGGWLPHQKKGRVAAELDTAVVGSEEREMQYSRTTHKKYSSCECIIM